MNLDKYPLVSVIIPFYNHNHFIKYTLDSILEDTYQNKEIIIINDGSSNPDDSNIIEWIDKNDKILPIKYISRENRGLTSTLNELIGLANGKYILLCASDDYLINNTIEKRVSILETNPKKKLLLSDAVVVDDHNNIKKSSSLFELYSGKKENYFQEEKIKNEIITNWSVAGATHLIRKDIYSEIGFYDETLDVEDYDFFLRVIAKDLILFYDEKVSAYRQHSSNLHMDYGKKLKFYHDFRNVALKNHILFDEPYKTYLLNMAKGYDKAIKYYPYKKFFRDIRIATKPLRYKIKELFGIKKRKK